MPSRMTFVEVAASGACRLGYRTLDQVESCHLTPDVAAPGGCLGMGRKAVMGGFKLGMRLREPAWAGWPALAVVLPRAAENRSRLQHFSMPPEKNTLAILKVLPERRSLCSRNLEMSGIPLTRCQFLIPFVGVLKDIGSSPDHILEKFRLPISLEEKAHHYIPLLPAIGFAEVARRSQGIVDFGFQAARQVQFSHLSERIRALISHSPTLLTALRQVCKWSSIEDTILSMWLEPCGDQVRICSRLVGTEGLPHLEHSQWLQLVFTIHVVRHFAGPHWSPATIAFEARYAPTLETQSLWPHSRFLSGQHASWIDVPVAHLSLPAPPTELPAPSPADGDGPSGYEIGELIKLMLPAYLDEGLPTLDEVAEMAGLSARSVQRRLSHFGLSYSDLVSAARFENARRLLRDTDAKVIEVAFASGYTDHAHFTRAFRRMSGVTPRHFRQQSRQRV